MPEPLKASSFNKRFLIFQFSKFIWGITVLFVVLAVYVFQTDKDLAAWGLIGASLISAYIAYRMSNQYRCINPQCNRLLVFSHGSSASSGLNTFVNKCPYCGVTLN